MGKKFTREEFITKAAEVHGDKYDYSFVEYVNYYTKVCIICRNCGNRFLQTPGGHLRGYGCRKCCFKKKVNCTNKKKWDIESASNVAQKYDSLYEFRTKDYGAYIYLRKNDALKNMEWLKKKRKYWSIEDVISESKKYTSRSDFCRKSHVAYLIALKNNMLDYMTWLIPKNNNYKNGHIIYSYIDEINKAVYIGQTLRPKERDKEHKSSIKSSVNKYFLSVGMDITKMNILETNLQDIESQIRENYWVEYYKKNGYKIINIAKTGYGSSSLGLARIKWTKSKIYKEASKYKSLGEFREGSGSAYQIACRKKYIQEIAEKFNWRLRVKWGNETCLYYFSKCKSISEFKKKYGAGYKYALKNKISLTK